MIVLLQLLWWSKHPLNHVRPCIDPQCCRLLNQSYRQSSIIYIHIHNNNIVYSSIRPSFNIPFTIKLISHHTNQASPNPWLHWRGDRTVVSQCYGHYHFLFCRNIWISLVGAAPNHSIIDRQNGHSSTYHYHQNEQDAKITLIQCKYFQCYFIWCFIIDDLLTYLIF